MGEDDILETQTLEALEHIGSADLVVGLLGCRGGTTLDAFVPAVEDLAPTLPGVARIVVAYPGGAAGGAAPETPPAEGRSVLTLGCPSLGQLADRPVAGCAEQAHRAVFALGRRLKASACVVLAANDDGIDPRSVSRLAGPLLARGLDLVTPCHARPRLGGLINNAIVYPLVRALYGRRVRCLIGSDFALSSRFAEQRLRSVTVPGAARVLGTLDALVSEAVVAGLQIGQVHAGPWQPPDHDRPDLSAVLAEVLSPLLLDMERHAAFWQKIRSTQPVETFGRPEPVADDGPAVNVGEMIHACQIGCRNLQEVWSVVLPPATLLDLKRLGLAPEPAFVLADDLWVRIVFDFALGHRMRVINRDHLLRALTPLYLGWVASFLREVQSAGPEAIERRVERLCLVYEREKPYLLSRWRWPDRFTP